MHFVILAYHHFDERNVGSRRWREMIPYIAERGRVTAISSDEAPEVYDFMQVIRVKDSRTRSSQDGFIRAEAPNSLEYRVRRLITDLVFIPDRKRSWARRALKQLGGLLNPGEPTIVVTTSPMHSLHVEMLRFAQRFVPNLTWVMDLRDPWTTAPESIWTPKWPPCLRRLEVRMETACHRRANLVTCIGERMAAALRERFRRPIEVIYNGYKEREHIVANTELGTRIPEVRYLGKIIERLRDPSLLFDAVRGILSANSLALNFWSNSHDFLRKLAQKHQIADRLLLHDRISHAEALAIESRPGANLILNGVDPQFDYILTAKAFELIERRRPVIAITGKNSELRHILTACGCNGIIWNARTAQTVVERCLDGSLNHVQDRLGQFSRRSAALQFLDACERLETIKRH
jgi:hypothetical protein